MNTGWLMGGWIFTGLFMAVSTGATFPGESDSDFGKILDRFRELQVAQENPAESRVRELTATLDDAGRWPDLNYDDQSRGNWHPYQHLQRAREMALGWVDPGHAVYRDPDVGSAMLAALDDWIDHRYEAVNWWFNRIGAPRLVRDTVVVLGENLDDERRQALLEVIDQYEVRGTGANLVWSAELALHYGCLTGDEALVNDAVRRIQDEVTVGAAQGIQADWSFYQHGARLQTFHYGRSYLDVVAAVAWQLRETSWAFPPEKVTVLSRFILDGMQWMVRGRDTVPGTMDRMASRPGTLRVDLVPVLRTWRDVDPAVAGELDAFIERQEGRGVPLEGYRHFPYADFTVYHRPDFSFFLKTVSERTHLTESINEENLLGADLNTGDHYIVTDASNYRPLPPVWDWKRLPGVVRSPESLDIERRPFVGGLGDGDRGMAAMDLRREAGNRGFAVRRTWAFHRDWVLALTGGWTVRGEGPVYTGLDQRLLRGEVLVGIEGEEPMLLPEGDHRLERVRYLVHDGIVYFMLEASALCVRLGNASGSWYRINRNRSDEPLTEKVFLAVIENGEQPGPGGFVIAPDPGKHERDRWLRHEPWTVLRNDKACQAVRFAGGTAMAAFFEPGALTVPGEGELSVDRPCLAVWNEDEIRLADPTHDGGTVRVRWRGYERTVALPAHGESIVIKAESNGGENECG